MGKADPRAAAAEAVAAALAATHRPTGRRGMIDTVLATLDDAEREAWLAVLEDESIPAQHVHRAMRWAGLGVGTSDGSVKTWRAQRPTG